MIIEKNLPPAVKTGRAADVIYIGALVEGGAGCRARRLGTRGHGMSAQQNASANAETAQERANPHRLAAGGLEPPTLGL